MAQFPLIIERPERLRKAARHTTLHVFNEEDKMGKQMTESLTDRQELPAEVAFSDMLWKQTASKFPCDVGKKISCCSYI